LVANPIPAHYCPVKSFGYPCNPQLLRDLTGIRAFFDLNS
jgi:hypothetical protein